MTRDELIARLEKLTGPNWRLSQAIGEFVGATPRYEHPGSENPSHLHYTHSIDAALTLLPRGAEYSISTLYGVAEVQMPLNADDWYTVRREDGSVPIALCIACLRAKDY